MDSKLKFPVHVRRDSVRVTIYRQQPATGYTSFVVVHREDGERKTKTYEAYHEARQEADAIATRLAKGEGQTLCLQGQARSEYERALLALRPTLKSLATAASEYAEAVKILGEAGS